MKEAYDKGQKPSKKGARYIRAITPEQENEIRRLYVPRRTKLADLANQFGTSKSTIGRIVNGHFDDDQAA